MNLRLLVLITLLGCAPAPQLTVVDFGADEHQNPMPFALRIVNDGAAVAVDAIEGECLTRMLISSDPNATAPTSAAMKVALTDRSRPGTVTLGARQSLVLKGNSEVWGVIGWETEGVPMLGFFEARFTLKRDGVDLFTTPLYAFVMQSEPGVLERVVAEADANDAARLLGIIDSMQGTRSAGLAELQAMLLN